MGGVTIKDVAARAGVAVSTVSRALNGHPDVSSKTRAKVEAAAKDLHFVTNNAARDLVMPQSNTIGLVVRGAENPFYTRIIHAIEGECGQAGYTLVLEQISVYADEIATAAALVRSKRLKGVIFLGGRFDYSEADGVSVGVPFACCTNNNDFGHLDRAGFSSVCIDDIAEARRATAYLIDHGHTDIALLLDSRHDHSISQLRLNGYLQAFADADLAAHEDLIVETVDFTMEAAYRKTRDLLASGRSCTAIFTVADTMAIAAMKAVHDAGLSVPDDVSVIGIDGLETSLYSIPTLTTLVQPQEMLGREAVRALLDMLRDGKPGRHIRLEATLRPGGTVGTRR